MNYHIYHQHADMYIDFLNTQKYQTQQANKEKYQ